MFDESGMRGLPNDKRSAANQSMKIDQSIASPTGKGQLKLPKISQSKYNTMQKSSTTPTGSPTKSVRNSTLAKRRTSKHGTQDGKNTDVDFTRVVNDTKRSTIKQGEKQVLTSQTTDIKNESHGEVKDGQEYTSDGDGSIADMTEKMKPKKKTKGKSMHRNFTIDPKDDKKNPLKAHFEKITHGEKSLSKAKLQEFLQGRYKDFVAKRITIQMDNYMGNFKG